MAVQLAPGRAIVPIVAYSAGKPIKTILGTGFFVGKGSVSHLVTAKHVIAAGAPVNGDDGYAFVFAGAEAIGILPILKIWAAEHYDIAVCEIAVDQLQEQGAVPLPLARENPSLNDDVLSYEYSSSRIEVGATNTHVSFEPYAHKGNIVRYFESTFPEGRATPSFLTSFPALRGASGAPILAASPNRKSFAVAGMTIANVERHLMPAQIVRGEDEKGGYEETSYFLPYGMAIALSPLVKCLEGMKIPFDYSDEAHQWRD